MMNAGEFSKAREFLLTHRSEYELAVTSFEWPKLGAFNWALNYFDPMAAGNDNLALWVVDPAGAETKLTFRELSERSNRVARYFRRLGVRRGDRMLVMLGNEVPLWETLLAAMKLGAVVIPAATLLGPEDLTQRLVRGGVRHVVAGSAQTGKFPEPGGTYTRISVGGAAGGWEPFEDAYEESNSFTADGVTAATDPLLLYFTSGTTAKPKLVEHSHQSYPVGHLSTMYWLGLLPGDLHWNISSPGWAKHAWSSWLAPWNAGAAVFSFNYARFNAQAVLDTLARTPITTLCAPPTVWRMLIQETIADYPVRLREAASAGEPLNAEVIERVRAAWGVTVRDGFGQTETTAMIGNSPGQPVRPGSMGRPLPGYRIELLAADGARGNEGEICLKLSSRPLGLMSGYAGAGERTVGTTEDGYYHTGDLASRDEEGYLTYIGRTDDVFKSSDYRISPFELESVLVRHPAVAEAAVVPCPHPVRHVVPKAFVLLAPGHAAGPETARSIFLFARQALAPYKRIRRLEFCDLPKTISGKIRRVQLRSLERDRLVRAGGGSPEYREEDFPDLAH